MIRLFIAIDIPDSIKKRVEGMGGSIPRAYPVLKEQLHLTLKFIGDIESSKLRDIEEGLEEVVFHPFKLSLKGVGTFPPRGTPRVLWIGIEPQEEIHLLRNKIEKTLFTHGIPKEKRKYAPHLTLARLKNSPVKRLQQFLAGNSLLQSPEFPVDRFSLYSSQLTPNRAIHTVLRTFFLG